MIDIVSTELYFTGGVRLLNPDRVTVPQGLTIVLGPNGSGKSTFGNVIERGWNFRTNHLESSAGKPRIKKIEFNDIHSLASDSVGYYQQRYESTMNDGVPEIAEIIGDRINDSRWKLYSEKLGINGLESRRINYLSSGQLRKFLIANALLEDIDLLILDNPYIGLDSASRAVLNNAIESLIETGVNVMLLISNQRDIPPIKATVIPIDNMTIGKPYPSLGISFADDAETAPIIDEEDVQDKFSGESEDYVLRMRHCKVSFGGVKVLDNINWDVMQGDKWWLSGPNGSGKSTLLSLLNADNPQAYCNDISLFGRKRGTGESIWDIKRRISYISPESSLHFKPHGSVEKVVAQGLTDTPFQPISEEKYAEARRWLKIMGIENLALRDFGTLSSGEKQMALLARAFVKQPELMILDEPFHGLDAANTSLVRTLITDYACAPSHLPLSPRHTLIIVSHYDQELPPLCYKHKSL